MEQQTKKVNVSLKMRKMMGIGMMSAIAIITVAMLRIPLVLFLKYEPKDVVIIIGGFLYGPLSAFAISSISSIVEMVTVSDTGIIGCIMNIISSCSFACIAALIYKKHKTLKSAIIGMVIGCALMSILMILWNYIVTPIFLGFPREAVVEMLIPVFLPFNLIKGSLNIAITLLLYKPIVNGLRRANLLPEVDDKISSKRNKGSLIGLFLLIITIVIVLLLYTDIL